MIVVLIPTVYFVDIVFYAKSKNPEKEKQTKNSPPIKLKKERKNKEKGFHYM